MKVYVHGAGRIGRDAWPIAPREHAIFAEFRHETSSDTRAVQLADLAPAGSVLIAHSAGAVPAVLAITKGLVVPRALVLVEPALFDVARGLPAIEQHIAAVSAARSWAVRGELFEFWQRFRPMFFSGPAEEAQWPEERATAEKFATIELPWGHAITGEMLDNTRMLVITGAWNDEYEEVAAALVGAGAEHVQLPGFNHRPQDHPDFTRVVDHFLERGDLEGAIA